MEYKSFDDKNHPLLTEFRRKIYREHGISPEFLEQSFTHSSVRKTFPNLGASSVEEIYKFGKQKWQDTPFERIEAALENGEVVSISGCAQYGKSLLRVSMHHYTLKDYRTRFRATLFREDGFFERHIDYAQKHPALEFLFFSIYIHNRKLLAAAKNMSSKLFTPESLRMKTLKDIMTLPEPVRLHGVDQKIFLYSLRSTENSPARFLDCLTAAHGVSQ